MGDAAAEVGGGSGDDGAADGSGCVDADGDGHAAKACGGDDCDDADPKAHPGQTDFFSDKSPTVGFDYDCDGY